jgi:hypothetical protein
MSNLRVSLVQVSLGLNGGSGGMSDSALMVLTRWELVAVNLFLCSIKNSGVAVEV